MMAPDELLDQLAATLRSRIGPAVGDTYARTQAFMAGVIVEKLARQLRGEAAHRGEEEAELAALFDDLDAEVGLDDPPALRDALVAARAAGDAVGLCPLIEALYAARAEIGDDRFEALRGRIRTTLRARLDRQVEVAA